MPSKEIRYLNKDFDSFVVDLRRFAQSYFPKNYQDFSDGSPQSLFLEQSAYVGDVLSFYLDKTLKEHFLDTATERGSVYELAQNLNYKPKTRSSAYVELTLSHLVPSKLVSGSYQPNYDYALTVESGLVVRSIENSNIEFRTVEPVDFMVNNDPNNPRTAIVELYDNSNNPSYYRLYKKVRAKSGKVKQVLFSFGDPIAYDKIILEDNNIIEVEKITDTDDNTWYEVENLAQDTIFLAVPNITRYDPDLSSDRSETPYLLKTQQVPRRFVTRVRSDNTLEIQFGAGVSSTRDELLIPNLSNIRILQADNEQGLSTPTDPSNFMNTTSYGLAPSNTTLTIRYTTSIGALENVSPNVLTDIILANTTLEADDLDTSLVSRVRQSLQVVNEKAATGARNFEDIEEIKINAKASFYSQNRAVTQQDYISRVYSMPPRYGSVAKVHIEKDVGSDQSNSVLNMYLLSYNSSGSFTQPNNAFKQNVKEYIDKYRLATDAVNLFSAFIINFKVKYEVVVSNNVSSEETLFNVNTVIKNFFRNSRMNIKQPIVLKELRADINLVEGVQFIETLELINLSGGSYSSTKYNFKDSTVNDIVYPPIDPAIFELKFPNVDIKGTVVGG